MPPVKIGQKIKQKIEGVGSKGDKYFKVDGFVVFFPTDKKEKDMILVEVIKVLEKVAFATEVNTEVDSIIRENGTK